MALQVWLPLNGNLNNNGVANVSITNNGATVSNDGKTGQCYYFNGSNSWIKVGLPSNMVTLKNTTICMWVKQTSGNFAPGGISHDSGYNNACCTLFGGRWQFVNGSTWVYYPSSYTVDKNWHHYACVIDNSKIYTYVDGVMNYSTDIGSNLMALYSANFIELGADHPGGDEFFGGYINDFRVYDEALSGKQIKEISKGLCVHYPLNQPDRCQNILTTAMAGDFTNFYSVSKSYNSSTRTWTITTTGTSATWGDGIQKGTGQGKALVPYGKRLCISFDIYSPTACKMSWDVNCYANSGTAWTDGNDADYTNYRREISDRSVPANTWVRKWFSYVNTNPGNTGKVDVYDVSGFGVIREASDSALTYYIRNIKYELQSESAVGPSTVYTPGWADSDSTINTEFDTSGFGNHGAAYSGKYPVYITTFNSPKYSGCYQFSGNQYLTLPTKAKIKDEITMNIWGYMSTWAAQGRLVSCTEAGGWNIEYYNNYINFPLYASGSYRNCTSSKKWADLSSGWHMFTLTYDGKTQRLYIDGVLDKELTSFTSKTPITYNSANTIFIGAEAEATATTPAGGNYFNGCMSDFRLYATALSAQDVKDLYDTPVAITNTGVLMTKGEFKEE